MTVAVALRGALGGRLSPLGSAHGVGVGGQQSVDHRLQQRAHHVRGGVGQQIAQDAGGVVNAGCGHRGDPFERAVKGDFEGSRGGRILVHEDAGHFGRYTTLWGTTGRASR